MFLVWRCSVSSVSWGSTGNVFFNYTPLSNGWGLWWVNFQDFLFFQHYFCRLQRILILLSLFATSKQLGSSSSYFFRFSKFLFRLVLFEALATFFWHLLLLLKLHNFLHSCTCHLHWNSSCCCGCSCRSIISLRCFTTSWIRITSSIWICSKLRCFIIFINFFNSWVFRWIRHSICVVTIISITICNLFFLYRDTSRCKILFFKLRMK